MGLTEILGEYGADRVIVVDDPELKEYRTEPYTCLLYTSSVKIRSDSTKKTGK